MRVGFHPAAPGQPALSHALSHQLWSHGDRELQAAWEREAAGLVGDQEWSEMRTEFLVAPWAWGLPVQARAGCALVASSRYSSSMKSLSNKFVHLTNYSVNKKNTEYKSNSDETACQGHKW